MPSANLLVADRSPEAAEHFNSLLRNSGINIHVTHAASSMDVKRILDSDPPVLILYAEADENEAPIEEVSELAVAFDVPLALISPMDEPERLARLLRETACYVINAAEEGLLAATVERLIRASENERLYAGRQQYLEELEHRYNLLLDSSRDAIAYIHEGLHVYANRAYLEILRLGDESETAALSLLELIKPRDTNTNLKTLLKGFGKGQFPGAPLEVMVTRPDDTEFEAELIFSAARFDGEDCTQMMLQRKDAASELASELERMRISDPVTQMLNRAAFTEKLDECIRTDSHETVAAVIYLEPDGFEKLQQELPADAADAFIADFAEVIRNCIGPDDTAGRVTDHGIAVLAHRAHMADVEAMAANIIKTYHSHVVDIDERGLSASCSIGVANIGRLSTDATEVIANARSAHSDAAATGDAFEVFRPQLTAVESQDGEETWLQRIRSGLENQDFYTVQQSIVDLDGSGDQIMENIVFLSGEGDDDAATQFQAIAERHDLAGAIDRSVIPGLLKTFVEQRERQIINVSSNSILDYAFPGWLAEQMTAACVEGSKVILQISSAAALNNLRPAQRLMRELSPLGCDLSVCHFDSERRTLQLLEHLDIGFVKLNHRLTQDLLAEPASQEAIRQIVEAAEKHGVTVIADEVADTSSLAVLWQCGVKLISGAFLSESSQVIAQ
jgi:diguanylate cyclase (GGDEF)-like protein